MNKIKTSENYDKLCEQLVDLENQLKEDKIKVIPLPKNTKKPRLKNWNTRKYRLEKIQKHKGNFGILMGYNNSKNGYSISVIDIDGYKLNTEDKEKQTKIKQQTQELLFESLKDIPNTLQVKTQSGGYHIYLWTKNTNESTSITSHNLYFPKDFKIKELAGKCLNDSLEIFTNEEAKQVVLPTSTIFHEDTNKIKEYKVISELNHFSDIEVTDDINELVIKTLKTKGYEYKPKTETEKPVTKKKFKKIRSNKTKSLRRLNKKEIKKVTDLVIPIFKITEGGKHKTALYLGGYLSYHIPKKCTIKIANNIIKRIGNIFDNTQDFRNTLLKNYDKKDEKAGLPTLCEHILEYDERFNINEFSDKLNSICNPKFKKEVVGSLDLDGKTSRIVLYEDKVKKYLKYENILDGMDLVLNPTTCLGSFNKSKTNEILSFFSFKFNNKFFDISKKELDGIKYSLELATVELPNYFIERIRTNLINLDKKATSVKEIERETELKGLFQRREKESYARKELAIYLNERGTILRKGINKPYIFNPTSNSYDSVEIDDIIQLLKESKDFEPNSISTEDVKRALTFIDDRLKPQYNIVKFKNLLYDIENFRVIENTEKPLLTLTEVQYDYNPQAEGELIIKFLRSSLKHEGDTEERLNNRIIAFYEMIGYILTSGNKRNAWFIFTGIGGAGKGVATNLITAIFGSENVGGLQLQELTPNNRFATAHLERKKVNIVRDSPKQPIEDTGMLKSITGYDDIPIEPKGKDKYMLPKEEVPAMITVCNNVPRFKNGFEEAIIQRIIIFEFLNRFRGTEDENNDLLDEILNNPQEMEFLLYQGIEAYKDMVLNNRDFKGRIDEIKTRELLGKHTDPIAFVLGKLVKWYDGEDIRDTEDSIKTSELNELIVFVSNKEGLNIEKNDKNSIPHKTLLNAIRREFNQDNNYDTEPANEYIKGGNGKTRTIRVYPNLYKSEIYDEYLKEMKNAKMELR